MIVGCYSLDLYCDSGVRRPYGTPGHSGHDGGAVTYTGHTYAQCAKQAKQDGWRLDNGNRTCLCPICAKEFKKVPATGAE